MTAAQSGGVPYRATPEGQANFGWYQGVVGLMAEQLHSSRGDALLAHIRLALSGDRVLDTASILRDLEALSPGLTTMIRSRGVALP
jgi:hypothetical protein